MRSSIPVVSSPVPLFEKVQKFGSNKVSFFICTQSLRKSPAPMAENESKKQVLDHEEQLQTLAW